MEQRREYAFVQLRGTVEDLAGQGRKTTAAGVKAALQKRTRGAFNESDLGFDSFRQFIQAAQAAGYVQVTDGPKDLCLFPPGVATPQPETSGYAPIRPDLWRCFVNWDDGVDRYYDKRADQTVMFPAVATPLDRREVTELRRAVEDRPEDFVRIRPISREEHLAWMREFLSGQHGPERQLLEAALGDHNPAGAFTALTRTLGPVGRAWSRFRLDRVSNVIADWVKENGLTIEFRMSRPQTSRTNSTQAAMHEPTLSADPRARIHAAIDRMPLHELLRLPIPAGYLLADD